MENEVEPIIGKTDVFIYPHGAQDRGSKAYQYLTDTDSKYRRVIELNLYAKPFLDPSKVYSEKDRQYFKGDKSYQ